MNFGHVLLKQLSHKYKKKRVRCAKDDRIRGYRGIYVISANRWVIRIKLGNRNAIEVTTIDNELASADKLKQSNGKERSVRREAGTASLKHI